MKALNRLTIIALRALLCLLFSQVAFASCGSPANAIEAENCLPGNPSSQWDINGSGDSSIQGFATDISFNQGQTVSFKVSTNATNYKLDIYRMGYYSGMGARLITTVSPSATLPQTQPACKTDSATGLLDCGNWSTSASWTIPTTATSGIYFAKVTRLDTGGASHVVFVVRNDSSHSDILFKTSDTTWEAYNDYGGANMYVGGPGPQGGAYKVSYNRPFHTRVYEFYSWVFNAEYPMVRFLESNGFDVTYFSSLDADRFGSLILNHKTALSVGHDEYWSGNERANVESARAGGVNLGFFSGNEVFWKTRWENSIDGLSTPNRTLVCYKETHSNKVTDPLDPPIWTGTWRDRRFSPPADGGRPENGLTGTMFVVNGPGPTMDVQIPMADGKMRFWRNTSVASLASNQKYTTSANLLGYEWDIDADNGFRPAGLFDLSTATYNISGNYLLDNGSTYGSGTAVHHLTAYRYSSNGHSALVFGAGTSQWPWALDGKHDGGTTVPDVNLQQATVNLFADMGVQPVTLQGGLIQASQSSDAIPPTSTITSPAPGSSVQGSSLVTVAGTAADAGGGVVGGVEVSTDSGATWHPASGRGTWTYNWTPGASGAVQLMSRAVDDSGNLEIPSSGISVTVAPRSCPCSIWSSAATPGLIDSGDANGVELGVRFRSDVTGFITGLRFYKSAANTGTHSGNLWTNTGALLATATFTSESGSGWQQANFSSPISITANTTYVASYFTPSGHYSGDNNYFASAGIDNTPLHALKDGFDGADGAYNYGSASSFPTSTYLSSNYWVDVVFATSLTGSSPSVVSVVPASGSSGVDPAASVTATFSEGMDPATINGTTFQLVDASNTALPATISYNSNNLTATLTPNSPLAFSTTYTAQVIGGNSGVKDTSGNPMGSTVTWLFTTGSGTTGPGGPILVISNSANPFTKYYSEILSAEGLNEFTMADLSSVTASTLANYDVAILGDMSLTSSQVSMLSNWVSSGGNLIAMHPDKQLAGLLGLSTTSSTLSNAYMVVKNSGAGAGIVGQSIQFHGTADIYGLTVASSVATLYSNSTTSANAPAVTLASAGTGQVAAFTYDLARSIVYTRQGNPAWSGQARDGQSGPNRSDDLYFGAASFDPQPDWVDLSNVAIPQADEQQRLLANLILQMNAAKKPLPRFWYFPSGAKAVVVMTGDDHGSFYSGSATLNRFNDFLAASPSGCSVPDWQCVRATSYLFPQSLATSTLSNSQAANFVSQGFEVAMHGDSSPTCTNWTTSSLNSFYTSELSSFANEFPSVPSPKTHRMHCIGWSDYDSQPQAEIAHGIRLDTTYYYWPPTWINNVPGMFTGSGIPMRFTDRNGNLINVYQATTQMTDESGQTFPFNIDTLLDNAVGASGYYGAFVANMHNDLGSYPGPGANQIVASAQARGVPVVSAQQMLTWLDGRNSSSFGSFSGSGNTFSFNITAATETGARNLRAMLPSNIPAGTLSSLSKNGGPISFAIQTIKGVQYAFFPGDSGLYQASYSGAPAVTLSSVSLNPTTVVGGSGSTGTLTLTGAAPSGGAVVTLASNNASAQVPASITVPTGQTTATFNVTTTAVSASTQVSISATYGTTQTAALTVNPASSPTLASITVSPATVTGGNNTTGTVTLSAAAPTGGSAVTLSSNNAAAQVPASVTVAAGATIATFNIVTTTVSASTQVTISATYGTTLTAALTVNPASLPTLTSVTVSPVTVTGGNNTTGTVTLSAAAPTGGSSVTLSSNNAAAQVPASVTVAAGATTGTFAITTSPVSVNTAVTISGTYGVTQTATLTVAAAALNSMTVSPPSVVGGNNSTGTATLTGPAAAGGAVVALQSGNTAVAQVPASVTVQAGATNATYAITTSAVVTDSSATITGTYITTRTTSLAVTAVTLSSISKNPASVVGGGTSTATVTLSGAAPAGGALVTLQSSNPATAQVPASITVAAGLTSANFTITTSPVTSNTSVTITGIYGVTQTTPFTVNAASLLSVTKTPSTVVGGNNSTGTVTLNGAAPSGGAVVALQSNNSSAAQVPASVTISAGSTTASFPITTSGVASSTVVAISGSYITSRSTNLTVNPAALTSLTLNPSTVTGGGSSTGTLTLNGAAPPNGAVISLSTSNSFAQVPASATIPAGGSTITFPVTTSTVNNTRSSIIATYGSNTRRATLIIQ